MLSKKPRAVGVRGLEQLFKRGALLCRQREVERSRRCAVIVLSATDDVAQRLSAVPHAVGRGRAVALQVVAAGSEVDRQRLLRGLEMPVTMHELTDGGHKTRRGGDVAKRQRKAVLDQDRTNASIHVLPEREVV